LKHNALPFIAVFRKVSRSNDDPIRPHGFRQNFNPAKEERNETDTLCGSFHRSSFTICIGLVLYRARAGSIRQEPGKINRSGL
jgi:hypothetical protein